MPRKLFLLGVLVLLAAGCLDGTNPARTANDSLVPEYLPPTAGVLHRAGGQLLPFSDVNPLAIGGQYSIGLTSWEPTIGVTKDGSVFMTALAPNPTFDVGPTIVRSTDKGQTWTDIGPKLPTGDNQRLTTFDPYLYVDAATDRIFMDDIYPIGCGAIAHSDDRGDSWSILTPSCGNPNVNDHHTLVAAKPRRLLTVGYPDLIYRCVNNVAYVGCAISLDGGTTFLPQVPLQPTLGGFFGDCAALTGHLEADHEGRVFLPLNCQDAPSVAVTEDDGLTWTLHTINPKVKMYDHDVDLAVDDGNGLYALWPDAKGHVWFAHSEDHGATWSPALDVTGPGVTATMFVAIAAGSSGHVAFSYIGSTVEGGYKGKGDSEQCSDPIGLDCSEPSGWENATWNAYIGLMTDARATDPLIQTVTANDPADPIARGFCGHSRCHEMYDFIDIHIDADGRPWSSFVDVCTQECVKDSKVHHDQNVGFAGTLQSGPALRGASSLLPLISPPPLGV